MPSYCFRVFLHLSLLLLLGLSNLVNAAPPTLDDFAYSAKLSNAKTSLRQINLPIEASNYSC